MAGVLQPEEFQHLIEIHGPALYRLAYRLIGNVHDAEDVLQETFRCLWAARERYDARRGARAFLVSILRRRVADYWRHRRREEQLWGPLPPLAVGDQDPTQEEFCDEVQQALQQLPPELRETLLLVVVGELTHQEAAQVLGVPLGTVLSRVARARTRLRQTLLQSMAAEK